MNRVNGGLLGTDPRYGTQGFCHPSARIPQGGVFDTTAVDLRRRVERWPYFVGGFAPWAPTNLQTGTNWPAFQAALQAQAGVATYADETVTPTGTYPGSSAFLGGVLLPDGRVFCVPFSSTSARIYDPATNTLSTPAGTYPGSDAFFGGVLLPDGRVFCVPHKSTSARIYDPATNTLSTPTGTYPGSTFFYGGVLLPDGRVFCVPRYSTSARIYDPATNTLSTPAGTYPGSDAFAGGVLLPDGRVFCVPFSYTSARIYGGQCNVAPLNYNLILSPYFNKL